MSTVIGSEGSVAVVTEKVPGTTACEKRSSVSVSRTESGMARKCGAEAEERVRPQGRVTGDTLEGRMTIGRRSIAYLLPHLQG